MNLQDYTLLDQPISREFEVSKLKKYILKFNLFSDNFHLSEIDSYLIQFDFAGIELSEEELKINNLSSSEVVGSYKYINISKKLNDIAYNICIPDRVSILNISIQKWKGDFKVYIADNISLLETDVICEKMSFKFQIEKIKKDKLKYEKKIKYYRNKIEETRHRIENTLSFRLGNLLVHSIKSYKNFILLPQKLFILYKNKRVSPPILNDIEIKPKAIRNKSIRNLKEIKVLSILDPISEHCWGGELSLFPLERKKFIDHISISNADLAFFESAWQANKKAWIYAFNSPKLKHQNAQDLLLAIELLKKRHIPSIFWNKEDPMHYKMFLPIAKKIDYIFTTDSNMIDKYKKDCANDNVFALKFAAPIQETNPINRFIVKNETVSFAGTYYAKNHLDRKKQMDSVLPALLDYDGIIYDRASESQSENYLFPEIYNRIIQPSIPFNEMIPTYKKFKVFLNVNTITNSPTMMSRRVYELLACGTPVISTPSKAITEQFPGIVLTVRNIEETKMALDKLLNDQNYWYKISHLGYRKVMTEHTYDIRSKEILKALKIDFQERKNTFAIIYNIENINSISHIKFFLENLINTGMKFNVIFITNKDSNKISKEFKNSRIKYSISEKAVSEVFKEVENNVDYIIPLHSKNLYFDNYISDLLLPFKYSKCYVSTKESFYDQNFQLNNSESIHRYVEHCNLYRSILNAKKIAEINIVNESIQSPNKRDVMYSADQFNLIHDLDPISEDNTEGIIYKYSTSIGI